MTDRQCAAAWAAALRAHPLYARTAFWAGGGAVKRLLVFFASAIGHYRTFIDIGAAVRAKVDDDVGTGAMGFVSLWGREHPCLDSHV